MTHRHPWSEWQWEEANDAVFSWIMKYNDNEAPSTLQHTFCVEFTPRQESECISLLFSTSSPLCLSCYYYAGELNPTNLPLPVNHYRIQCVCSDSLNPYQNTMCCVGGKCTERKELSYHVGIDFCWNRIQTWLGSGFFDSFFLWSTQPLNLLFIHVFYHMIVTLCIMIMSCSILCELGKLTRHLPTHDSDRNERILTRFSHFLDKTLLYRSIFYINAMELGWTSDTYLYDCMHTSYL